MILIKIEKCGHCFYYIYHDIIEYRDNFLDNNREIFFLISPNPSVNRAKKKICVFPVSRPYLAFGRRNPDPKLFYWIMLVSVST
jgi:hypothetical protein